MNHRLSGPAEAPVVLMVHGILTSLAMWDGVCAALGDRWRVLRHDLRGHGGTPAPAPPYTMAQLADDTIALLDRLGLERVHFIGASLGGMIGQQVAARHGGRLSSLTLANTAADQAAPQAWAERIATAQTQGIAPLVEPTLERWFTPDFRAGDAAAVERMRRLARATSVQGFAGCAAAVRDLAQLDLLPRIRVPTLVIAGAHDTATPPAQSRLLQERIPGARLEMLPAAHQSAVECPQAFADAWERFARTADRFPTHTHQETP